MITGRCECGKVKYRVEGKINDFSHCHCSQCRRLHGAAFASFAGVSRVNFTYDGGEQDLKCYASSPSHGRVFCGHCGSNILVELEAEPEQLYVAMGTMDGDFPLPPGYHIYVDSKAPWHTINDNLSQYETEPDE
jgi:hypothetical protein